MPNISLDLYPSDPDPADSTAKKNHAGPGLPNQPENHSGRNTMVSAQRARVGATAARTAAEVTEDVVTYNPHDLNRLIATVAAREVAGRLRERAAWHREQAIMQDTMSTYMSGEPWRVASTRAAWHRREAGELERLAVRELETALDHGWGELR